MLDILFLTGMTSRMIYFIAQQIYKMTRIHVHATSMSGKTAYLDGERPATRIHILQCIVFINTKFPLKDGLQVLSQIPFVRLSVSKII